MRNTLIFLSILFLATNGFAQEGYSAKSLFFAEDDSVVAASTSTKSPALVSVGRTETVIKQVTTVATYKKPVAPKQIGASYFIRLKNNDGSSQDVLASRKFKTGERFQLAVKVNHPTYIYILNEAPDGKVTQIYPQQGNDNFINAMGTVFLPGKGSFEFDHKPGTEQLLVYLSPTQLPGNVTERVRAASPDIVSAFADTSTIASACTDVRTVNSSTFEQSEKIQLASADTGYAPKGIAFKDDLSPACGNAQAQYRGYASKGITFSDDPEPAGGGQIASYVVKKVSDTPDKSLFLKLKLVHE